MRARDAGWSAVDDDQKRVALRIEVGRHVQHAFDCGAVLALPRHDLEGARRPGRGLSVQVGDLLLLRRSVRARYDVHLRHRSGIRAQARVGAAVFGEREARIDGAIGRVLFRHRFGFGIELVEIRVGARRSGKEKAVRFPGDDLRVLVEGARERRRGAAARGNRRDEGVRVEVGRIGHRGLERDARAVGRPHRVRVGAFLRDEFADRPVCDRDD